MKLPEIANSVVAALLTAAILGGFALWKTQTFGGAHAAPTQAGQGPGVLDMRSMGISFDPDGRPRAHYTFVNDSDVTLRGCQPVWEQVTDEGEPGRIAPVAVLFLPFSLKPSAVFQTDAQLLPRSWLPVGRSDQYYEFWAECTTGSLVVNSDFIHVDYAKRQAWYVETARNQVISKRVCGDTYCHLPPLDLAHARQSSSALIG